MCFSLSWVGAAAAASGGKVTGKEGDRLVSDAGDVMREAVAAYAAGESMTAVAHRFDMSPARPRRRIVAAGVTARGTGLIAFDSDELRRRYIDEGPAIAASTGLSVSAGDAVARCGVDARKASKPISATRTCGSTSTTSSASARSVRRSGVTTGRC